MKPLIVEGLNEDEADQFLSQLNPSPSKERQANLHEITQGNPQFVILMADILNQQQEVINQLKLISEDPELDRDIYIMEEVDKYLNDNERSVMSALSICMEHPAPYPLIEEIADQGNLSPALTNLRRRYLLLLYKDASGVLYSQHTIIQEFYYGLVDPWERKAMHARAAAYYSTEEQDVFRAALHYNKAGEFEQAIEHLIGEYTLPLIYQGHSLEASQLLSSLREKISTDNNIQSRILQSLGIYYRIQGAYESAIQTLTTGFEQAISASEQVEFLDEIIQMHRYQGAFDNALQTIEQVQKIHKQNPALLMEAKSLNNMGWVYYRLGNLEEAERYFALAWERSLEPRVMANTKQGLGTVAYRKGILDVALTAFHRKPKNF